MKLTIEQKTLSKMLAEVTSIVERRTTMPIMANVAMSAKDGNLTMIATDLDIEHTITTPVDIVTEGGITANAAMLMGIVGKLPAGSLVILETDEKETLHISAGRSKVELPTLPIDQFPHMASSDYDVTFALPSQDLARLFNLAKGCMSTEETRYYLQGIYLHNVEGIMRAVSTDGHRLAQINGPATVEFPGVIVPRKTVGEVCKTNQVVDVQVSVSDTKIKFDFGSSVIVSKVIDGTFPAYEAIIPRNNPNRVTVNGASLKSAADRVASVSLEKSRAVKLEVTNDAVKLSSRAPDTGYAEDIIDATLDGGPVTSAFNSKYLAEIVTQIDGDVTMALGGALDPAVLTGSDLNALWVIMPQRYN